MLIYFGAFAQSDPCDPIDIGQVLTYNINASCVDSSGAIVTCQSGSFSDGSINFQADCWDLNDPVVWYKFSSTDNGEILNVSISAQKSVTPAIQLFESLDSTCTTLHPIGLTEENFACVTGIGGSLISTNTIIRSNSIYYLAVANDQSTTENFEVCLQIVSNQADCVTDQSIEITSKSNAGSLDGPFFPGETLSVCMNVLNFSTAGNGCQWFQGIVPVFGDAWDVSSFDSLNQPLNATLNGESLPRQNIHNSGVFDWWTTASYHHDNCLINIGDFNNNGRLDLCSPLFNPNCGGSPLLKSTGEEACWYDEDPGTILPGGWFTSGVPGSCASDGYPGVDWGDGDSCSGNTGPWSFCFDLIVRSDCPTDSLRSDLSIGFFSFSDGEVGAWNGNNGSVCGNDLPSFIYPEMVTEPFDILFETNQNCSEVLDTLVLKPIIESNFSSDYTFLWSNGSTDSILTIVNPNDNDFISLEVTDENGCVVTAVFQVDMDENLDLMLSYSNINFCEGGAYPISVIPSSSEAQIVNYEWIIPGPDTLYTDTIIVTQTGVYSVNVIDENGCEGSFSIELNFYQTPQIGLPGLDLFLCDNESPQDFPIIIDQSSLIITLEDTNMIGSGVYNYIVTDASNGCTSIGSLTYVPYPTPTSVFGISQNGNQIIVTDSSSNADSLIWDFGNGVIATDSVYTIAYDSIGTYEIQLVAFNPCGESDTSAQFITIMTTGISDSQLNKFKLYPNPAKNHLMVEGDFDNLVGRVNIMDILGRVVLSQEVERLKSSDSLLQMDISSLDNGLYYLNFQNGGGSQVLELLIQR